MSLWGDWKLESGSNFRTADLEITDESPISFAFKLWLTDGARDGSVEGVAKQITPGNFKHISPSAWEEGLQCELTFRLVSAQTPTMSVSESDGCMGHHGADTKFDGLYVRAPDSLRDQRLLDTVELSRIKRLTAGMYEKLSDQFQLAERLAQFEGEQFAVLGQVRGLATANEGIIVLGSSGYFWAAFVADGKVYFFSEDPSHASKRPAIFDQWRSRFQAAPVVVTTAAPTPSLN